MDATRLWIQLVTVQLLLKLLIFALVLSTLLFFCPISCIVIAVIRSTGSVRVGLADTKTHDLPRGEPTVPGCHFASLSQKVD